MAFASPATRQKPQDKTHRIYADPHGSTVVACQPVSYSQLLRLAAGADQIEIRQPMGGGWVPSDVVDRLVGALRALPLLTSDRVTNAGTTLQRLRLTLSDRLARIRIRHGRHILVGETHREAAGKRQRVLVLVLAQKAIASCDWRLA